MSNQVRGIILEGQSCSGKTSIFNAIKRHHFIEKDAERNVIYLSEQYSQTLNLINGELKNLSQEENLRVLSDRISMLEQLNHYASCMGEHSRCSRGLFYVFERFHLNYAFSFNDVDSYEYLQLEKRLSNLNAKVVLCTISSEKTEPRLRHRSHYTKEEVTQESIDQYIARQQQLINIAEKSSLPTMIINTDNLIWDSYADMILNSI